MGVFRWAIEDNPYRPDSRTKGFCLVCLVADCYTCSYSICILVWLFSQNLISIGQVFFVSMIENSTDSDAAIVKFSTKLQPADYSRAFLINLVFKQKKFWLRWSSAVVVWIVLCYTTLPYPLVFSISLPVMYIIIHFSSLHHRFLAGIKKNNKNFEQVNWQVHRDYMHGVGETFETRVYFRDVIRFFSKGGYYIIYSVKKFFVFIPKRQISKDAERLFDEIMHFNNGIGI
jgi:hypothetical protein